MSAQAELGNWFHWFHPQSKVVCDQTSRIITDRDRLISTAFTPCLNLETQPNRYHCIHAVIEAIFCPLIDINSTLFDADWHYPCNHDDDDDDPVVESQLGVAESAGDGVVFFHAERDALYGKVSRRPSLTRCP